MKKPLPICKQWDVVVLPFPYTDKLAEKRRPAVVVSQPWISNDYGLVWVVMITSAANAGWTCDIELADLERAGLSADSVIRPVKIATVDKDRILRVAGQLDADTIAALKSVLGGYI